jgi:hypothetical protein
VVFHPRRLDARRVAADGLPHAGVPVRKPFALVPLHPFLLSAYFVLFLVAHNLSEIVITDAVAPALLSLGGSLVLYLALRRLPRNPPAAALVVSILLVFFFLYGRLHTYFLTAGFPHQN